MKRWRQLLALTVLGHFGLTICTGLLWYALVNASASHAPVMLRLMYASFCLFVPFCQPVFWPLSDWVSYSGHFNLPGGPGPQIIKFSVIAFINSLTASVLLFGLAGVAQAAWRHQRKLPDPS